MAPLQSVFGLSGKLLHQRCCQKLLTRSQTSHSIPHAVCYKVAQGEQPLFLLVGTADTSMNLRILGPSLWWAALRIWSAASLPGKCTDR